MGMAGGGLLGAEAANLLGGALGMKSLIKGFYRGRFRKVMDLQSGLG